MARIDISRAVFITNSDADTEAIPVTLAGGIEVELGANVGLLSIENDVINPAAAYAEDTAHTTADWVTPAGTVRQDDAAALAGTDGDYQPLVSNKFGSANVAPQHSKVIDTCDATTGWTALSDATTGLTTDLDHVYGTASL